MLRYLNSQEKIKGLMAAVYFDDKLFLDPVELFCSTICLIDSSAALCLQIGHQMGALCYEW